MEGGGEGWKVMERGEGWKVREGGRGVVVMEGEGVVERGGWWREGVVESEAEGWEWWGLMERGWRRLMERCWTSSPFVVASSWRVNVVAHRCRLVVASPGRVVVVPCCCCWLVVVPSCGSMRWVRGRWDGGYLPSINNDE